MEFDYSVVAFIDILGFSEMINNDATSNEQTHLPKIAQVVSDAISEASGSRFSVRLFSDCMMVSAKYSIDNALKIIDLVKSIQWSFVSKEVLVRGGISYGKHYENDEMIFSKGLVEAYQLESRHAKYPRILVDTNLIDLVEGTSKELKKISDELRVNLIVDEDGLQFIHYLDSEKIVDHKTLVDKIIGSSKLSDSRIKEKMVWLSNYHNFSVELLGKGEINSILKQIRFKERV